MVVVALGFYIFEVTYVLYIYKKDIFNQPMMRTLKKYLCIITKKSEIEENLPSFLPRILAL